MTTNNLGIDLATTGGDLLVNAQGDLGQVTGVENLTEALRRRFNTPVGALFYAPEYGNPLLARLSQPMGRTFEADAAVDARACLISDARVRKASVRIVVNREQRSVTCSAEYEAIDGSSGSFEEVVTGLV
jgi:phage baseplate assembly protein W